MDTTVLWYDCGLFHSINEEFNLVDALSLEEKNERGVPWFRGVRFEEAISR